MIVGCGNPLFFDDGFGPAVIDALKEIILPGYVKLIDAGTSGPEMIFSLLDPETTQNLIVLDILDHGRSPGTVTRIERDNLLPGTLHDFHQGGIAKSLGEISEKINVTLIGCQPELISYPYMQIGLSKPVQRAVSIALQQVIITLEYLERIKGKDYGKKENGCCFTCLKTSIDIDREELIFYTYPCLMATIPPH